MDQARDEDRADVHEHEGEHRARRAFVQLLQQVAARAVRRVARERGGEPQAEQREHRPAAGRVMPDVVLRPEGQERAEIARNGTGTGDERRKARVAATDKSPRQAKRDQPGKGVAERRVHADPVSRLRPGSGRQKPHPGSTLPCKDAGW